MFDPSQELHDYFVQKGYSDLEAHKLANQVSGRCPVGWRAQTQTQRTGVTGAETHMQEENQEVESAIIDLGFDVSEADIAFPTIKPGTYDAKIVSVTPAKSKSGADMLEVRYRLLDGVTDLSGREVKGMTIMQRLVTQPTGGLTQEMIKRNVGRVQIAAAGPGRVNTGTWKDKHVRIRVSLREAHRDEQTGEEYPASNDIANVLPATKSAEADA
jgi:hypothetical protein